MSISLDRACVNKAAFHDTDTDILAEIVARMSVSVSWNAALYLCAARCAGSHASVYFSRRELA